MVANPDGLEVTWFRCTSDSKHDLCASWCDVWEVVRGPHVVKYGRLNRGRVHVQEHVEAGASASLERVLDKVTSMPVLEDDAEEQVDPNPDGVGLAASTSSLAEVVVEPAADVHDVGLRTIIAYINGRGGEAPTTDTLRFMAGAGWVGCTVAFLTDTFVSPSSGRISAEFAPRPALLLADVMAAAATSADVRTLMTETLATGASVDEFLAKMTETMDALKLAPARSTARLARKVYPVQKDCRKRVWVAAERFARKVRKDVAHVEKLFAPQDAEQLVPLHDQDRASPKTDAKQLALCDQAEGSGTSPPADTQQLALCTEDPSIPRAGKKESVTIFSKLAVLAYHASLDSSISAKELVCMQKFPHLLRSVGQLGRSGAAIHSTGTWSLKTDGKKGDHCFLFLERTGLFAHPPLVDSV